MPTTVLPRERQEHTAVRVGAYIIPSEGDLIVLNIRNENTTTFVNAVLSAKEVDDLITILQYHRMHMRDMS